MDWNEFAPWGRLVADWAADYHRSVGERPVRARTRPGAILDALPASPPDTAQDMEDDRYPFSWLE